MATTPRHTLSAPFSGPGIGMAVRDIPAAGDQLSIKEVRRAGWPSLAWMFAKVARVHGEPFFLVTQLKPDYSVGYVWSGEVFQRASFPTPQLLWLRQYSVNRLKGVQHQGAKLFIPEQIAELSQDKYEQGALFRRVGIDVPSCELMSEQALLPFLVPEGRCILKPRGSSRGRGIYLGSEKNGEFHLAGAVGDLPTMSCPLPAAANEICRHLQDEPYLVQEFIESRPLLGRASHIRTLVYRNGTRGRPRLAVFQARIGRSGYVGGNINQGGSAVRFRRLLWEWGPLEVLRLYLLAKRQSIAAFLEAEASVGGPIGGLGFDLLVDRRGRLVFLEMNARFGVSFAPRVNHRIFMGALAFFRSLRGER